MGGDSEGAGEDIGVDRGWRLGRQARHLLPAAERTKRHTDMPCAHFRRSGGPPDTASAHLGRNEASAIPAGLDTWNPTDDRRTPAPRRRQRSEEHTSELQSLMRISYAVFCLKKKKQKESTIKT